MNEKLLRKLLELLNDENDPDNELRGEIRAQLQELSDYEDREIFRQESQWDPAYIYDLTHLRDPYDDWDGDDPYESMYH